MARGGRRRADGTRLGTRGCRVSAGFSEATPGEASGQDGENSQKRNRDYANPTALFGKRGFASSRSQAD
jgi:hypothetical protein